MSTALINNSDILKNPQILVACTDDLYIKPTNSYIYLPINSSANKPDFDEENELKYDITYRNGMGKKCPKQFIIDYKEMVLKIVESENVKENIIIPVDQLALAIPSENVNTQVTILTRENSSREAYKIWVPDENVELVEIIIKNINRMISLHRDIEEKHIYSDTN